MQGNKSSKIFNCPHVFFLVKKKNVNIKMENTTNQGKSQTLSKKKSLAVFSKNIKDLSKNIKKEISAIKMLRINSKMKISKNNK